MATPSPATYGLLGLLATRSWTGYELTQQVRRSLRFAWATSEGHLYREQKRLVDLGWATVTREPAGRRSRNRYAITDQGRAALRAWLGTEPEEPHLHIEGILRVFFGDAGTVADAASAVRSTAQAARAMHDELLGFVDEYLAEGGPLSMLEAGVGGPGQERLEFAGRPMFPERLHVVAVALDLVTALLDLLATSAAETADELAAWPGTDDPALTPATRDRLERIRSRRIPSG